MSTTTVLIVEDEGIVAKDLSNRLVKLGYEVCGIAAQAHQAVQMAQDLKPGLILMDIQLDGPLDGIEAAETIQREHDIPMIYLTAHSDPAMLARAKLTGPSGYILKPFEERELATQVELALYKHKADRQLREQREWLRVTLTSIGDAVIATDDRGRISFLNPVAEALTGWTVDEATGRPVGEVFRIINEQTRQALEEPVALVLRERRTVPLANHTAIITKDGRSVPIEDSAAPILDAAGDVIGVVLVFHDATKKRRAEEALQTSEKRYRQLLTVLPAAMYTCDAEGAVTYFNAQAAEIWGRTPPIGDTDERFCGSFRLHRPDGTYMPHNETPMAAVLRQGKRVRGQEVIIERPDQSRVWVSVNIDPQFDDGNQVCGAINVFTDITQRKQAEEALRESEEKFRTVFEQAAVGIGRVSFDDARWIEVNDTFCRMLGYTRDEFLSTPWPQITHPEDVGLDLIPFRQMAAGHLDSYSVEKRFIHKQGHIVWARLTLSLVRDYNGLPRYEIAVIENISEKKKAEEELLRINQSLEQQVGERTRLAEARSKQLQALAAELIEAEERERRRIANLLHDDLQQMLAAARMQLEPVDQSQPVEPTLSGVKQLLEESIAKSRQLSHELSPPVLQHSNLTGALQWIARYFKTQFGLQVELRSDEENYYYYAHLQHKVFLFRAVQELLFNAVKHSGAKSAAVALSTANGCLSITVSDQGRGIDPDILDSETPSHGLGLLSLRERARYIGGNLMIESAPERGSRFTLTLPLSISVMDEARQSGANRQPDIPAESVCDIGSGRTRVLFVDDHKVMRQGLINLLGNQPNIKVAGEASNGREAIDGVRQLKPDVVVMDVSMPEMDGIEATRHIKANWPEVRVIALSMVEDEHISRTIMEAGAEAFVSKTASSAELLKAIYGRSD